MIQKYFPYIFIAILIWYLPEFYLFARTTATNLFNEASLKSVYDVEIKVVKQGSFLPAKFAVLFAGEKNLRVELNSEDTGLVKSGLTDDLGTVIIESVLPGEYAVRIGSDPGYSSTDVSIAESSGLSVLEDQSLFVSSISEVTITKDVYLVPIIR